MRPSPSGGRRRWMGSAARRDRCVAPQRIAATTRDGARRTRTTAPRRKWTAPPTSRETGGGGASDSCGNSSGSGFPRNLAAPNRRSHMTAQATPARRRRRAGRLRQDGADGAAVQAAARQARHRRDHQRHLHQGGRAHPGRGGRAAAGADHGGRDGGLPAYRHPRGRVHQPRRRSPTCASASRTST